MHHACLVIAVPFFMPYVRILQVSVLTYLRSISVSEHLGLVHTGISHVNSAYAVRRPSGKQTSSRARDDQAHSGAGVSRVCNLPGLFPHQARSNSPCMRRAHFDSIN